MDRHFASDEKEQQPPPEEKGTSCGEQKISSQRMNDSASLLRLTDPSAGSSSVDSSDDCQHCSWQPGTGRRAKITPAASPVSGLFINIQVPLIRVKLHEIQTLQDIIWLQTPFGRALNQF